jgi:hypothetical protein
LNSLSVEIAGNLKLPPVLFGTQRYYAFFITPVIIYPNLIFGGPLQTWLISPITRLLLDGFVVFLDVLVPLYCHLSMSSGEWLPCSLLTLSGISIAVFAALGWITHE